MPIDIVMFCHSSLNEHVSTTVAGRLRAVVGSPCFPFSVSQQQGASTFTALQLADDLFIAEPEIRAILVVAAEKWCPPFSRWTDQGIVQGDAAGAILLERATCVSAGLRVIDARTNRFQRLSTQRPLTHPDIGTDWAPVLLSTIDAMLSRHKLHVDDLNTIVGPEIDPHLDELVGGHLKRRVIGLTHRRRVHLGAPELIVKLTDALESHNLPVQGRILMWGVGLGGYVGCALLEAHGKPHRYRNVERLDPS
ncbi:3-oxoacyl-ACP synthase [Burkholderia cepacia]|uniref:3-oxoacyl-ACP synthase n=1 Tax=Burkholderia cepacia TaxID=292 RepID=UPI001FC7D1F4|nr:3-oxoacyl-ACP synthase [Burkholderia cepacia]